MNGAMRVAWTLALLAAGQGLLSAPGVLRAEDKEVVAVLDLEPLDASKAQAAAFTDRVREELVSQGRYTLVDRNQLNSVLDEQALQQTGCTSQDCAVKVGKILGVRKLVTGRLTHADKDLWQVSATLLDVETSATVRQVSIQHEGPYRSLLIGGAGALVSKLVGPAGPAPKAQTASRNYSVMPTPRKGAAAGVIGGQLYVAGGERKNDRLDTLEVYNPRNDTWGAKAAMPTSRAWVAGAAVGDALYVIGGYRFNFDNMTDRVDVYRPASNAWTEGKGMPTARAVAATAVLDGVIYVIGGVTTGKHVSPAVEAYTVKSNSWSVRAPLGQARFAAAAVGYQGKVYVFGGRPDWKKKDRLDSVDIYDPVANAWTAGKPAPFRISHAAAIALDSSILLAGGSDGKGKIIRGVEVYDPAQNAWRRGPPLPEPRFAAIGVILDGTPLLVGGTDAGNAAVGLVQSVAR